MQILKAINQIFIFNKNTAFSVLRKIKLKIHYSLYSLVIFFCKNLSDKTIKNL